jgi:hypothetical protein
MYDGLVEGGWWSEANIVFIFPPLPGSPSPHFAGSPPHGEVLQFIEYLIRLLIKIQNILVVAFL